MARVCSRNVSSVCLRPLSSLEGVGTNLRRLGLSVSLWCPSVYLPVCMGVSLCTSVSLFLFLCLSVSLYFCLPAPVSLSQCVCLSVCLSPYVSTCLSVKLFLITCRLLQFLSRSYAETKEENCQSWNRVQSSLVITNISKWIISAPLHKSVELISIQWSCESSLISKQGSLFMILWILIYRK